MKHIMLDLETMGSGPDAAIIAIGAVEFDLDKQKLGKEFYVTVDLTSSVEHGGVIDPGTVLWWMKQSDEARRMFQLTNKHIVTALTDFVDFISACAPKKDITVWGNGAAFDNVILSSAFRRIGAPAPWEFWNDRCYRTVKALRPDIKMKREGTHHNALDDARDQTKHLFEILR